MPFPLPSVFAALPSAALASVGAPWMWGAFTLLIVFFLALDLGILNRKPHAVGTREALAWTFERISRRLGAGSPEPTSADPLRA